MKGSLASSIRAGAIVLVLGILAWHILSVVAWGGGDTESREVSPATANPSAPPAEVRSSGSPAEDDLDTAAELAAQALAQNPLSVEAIRTLGLAADRRGEPEKALALMRTAADRSMRDAPAQAWVINHALTTGDHQRALRHIDALLRTRDDVRQQVLPALASFLSDPSRVTMLADHLAGSPPWRSWFLRELASEAQDAMAPFALVLELRTRSSPPTPEELRPYLQRLIDEGRFQEAYVLWAQSLPPDQLARLGAVQNGGFDYPPTGLQFDWTLGSVLGASIRVEAPPVPHDGNALHVEFAGARVRFRHVGQTLLLGPGGYRLEMQALAEHLQNDRGLWWKVYCAAGEEIGSTETISGTTRWTVMQADFTVPRSGCPAQQLRLELAARIPIEQQVSGRVWFDDVTVTRMADSVSEMSD